MQSAVDAVHTGILPETARRIQGIFPESSLSRHLSLPAMRAAISFYRCNKWEKSMSWKTPRVIEIAVGMEINCYACADI